MEEVGITIAAKVSEYLVAPIGRQLRYLFCYRSYTVELDKEVQKLKKARDDVQITVYEARRRGDEIRPIVQGWLNDVDKITGEAEELMKDENKSCFNGWCPNLKSRYLLSRAVRNKTLDLAKIQQDRNFPDGMSYRLPPRNVTFKGYESFESRASTLNDIMDALRNDEMKMIGVCGMGGVGKTTLVKQVAEQAKQEKLFDTEIYIEVSWTREPTKFGKGILEIQQKIADMLGLEFKNEAQSTKATKLKQRLQKEKILIILDDIWKEVNFEDVGIPSQDDWKDCKIVLASRHENLLRKDMGAQTCFRIQHLQPPEAWHLFKKTAGDSVDGDELRRTAIEVVNECQGLPVAIVTIAKALKDESADVWQNALKEMRSGAPTNIGGVEEKVYKCLEWSYNHLKGDEVKSLFLLCGWLSYGDTSMDQLLRCAMGLDMFHHTKTLKEARNRLVTLVKILKASSLLLDDEDRPQSGGASGLLFMDADNKSVRMHDVVRDVARYIASKDPHRFEVREDVPLEESSKTDESKYISLNCKVVHELPQRLVYTNLQFFLLQNSPSLNIPSTFFEGMKGLKVLDLSGMHFTTLPSSLQSLANLRTLFLDRCKLGDIALIGELKKLQVLSMVGSDIQQLPIEMVHLTNLRLLDLNYCKRLKVIPRNILSSLSQLESLCMTSSFTQWTVEGASDRESNACLSEIKGLSHLTSIEVQIPDAKLLPEEDMFFDKLTRYAIFIGNFQQIPIYYRTSRTLKLEGVDGSLLLRDGIGKLLTKTEELLLENLKEERCGPIPVRSFVNLKTLSVMTCHGMKFLFLLSTARGLLQLEAISISSCNDMQQIFAYQREPEIKEDDNAVNNRQLFPTLRSLTLWSLPEFMNFGSFGSELETTSQGMCYQALFPNLEILELNKLPKLKEIWHHQLSLDSFSNLRILTIKECSCLLNLIPSHLMQNFKNLKKIHVNSCEVLEHAFFASVEDEALFPNLEILELNELPKLKEIWHHQLSLDSFSNLRILTIKECSCLLNLIPSHLMQNFKNLKKIHVNSCEVLEHAFFPSVEDKALFPNLEILELNELPKLKEIWHHQLSLDSFSNLRILTIKECSCLLNLISSHLMQNFKNLKKIHVNSCEVLEHAFFASVEDEVSFPNLETLEFCNLPKLKKIWHCQLQLDSFSNLQILIVKICPCLINLIPCHLIQSFHNLKEIEVSNCEVLKYVFDLQGLDKNIEILPKLETLKLERLPRLKINSLFSHFMPMNFRNLKYLSIKYCGNEDKDEGYVNTSIEDEVLFSEKVLFLNLEKLELDGVPKLKKIWHHQTSLESLCKLRILSVYNCPHLEYVFDHRGLNGNIRILPKIEILELVGLPRLRLFICNKDKNDNMRYLLSPFIFKDSQHLKELRISDCGMFFDEKVSFPDGVCYQAFESRASTFNNIMDALRDADINRIGVWGMGGVGKTTLLKQVAQQAKKQQLFTKQVYIDVSWTQDLDNLQQGISEIQGKIEDVLGLELWYLDKSIRASEVKKRLQKGNILIILDDIWKEINLEEVGIPSTGNETKCKIVLSSRDGDLLCKDMGTQKCFQVEHLLPQEAWSLFKKTAGDSVEENLQLRPIAIQVVEEYCEGLPIAILTIAKALKDETMAVWKNVLAELRRSAPTNIRGVGNKVYSCLKWSYTHLKGDDVKSLFLLCGMLGYGDISVDLLLQYCLGLDMFDHIDSLEQATNKLLTLVQILKASNLLFFNADNNSVRMHDVVSDVVRAIASKDPHPFIVREDVGFEEWLETDESKRCTFISLKCKLVPKLPHELVFPELQIFLLQKNKPSLKIPSTFFEGMKKLKVLDLPKTLPSALDSLANLRTLRLDGCWLVDIALIGKLTKLEVLSLVGSAIQQLPQEMAQLTNLRLLDLNDCKKLKVIPRNILSSLSQLECLCMKSSFTQWEDEGEGNACLSELNHLSHLTTLDIEIPNAELLPKDILFENLTKYTIFVGSFWEMKGDCKTKRALKLEGVLHLGDGISKLLGRSEEIEFMNLSGTKFVLYPSDRQSFVELKHLKVNSSGEIQYIIDSKDQRFLQHGLFPMLESLVLQWLNNLEEVWHGSVPTGSFGNLKTLNMSHCDKLKFLFLLSTARGLSQLEEMKIEYCRVMEQIIACERESEIKEDGHGGTNLQLFPKLRTLKLKHLPQLINFTPGFETTSSTSLSTNAMSKGSIFNHQFSFPILEKLTLKRLPKLKDIWFHQFLSGSCNLRMVKVSECPY